MNLDHERGAAAVIDPWGSPEAVKKERHVARFLEREYRAAFEQGATLAELGISATSGPMWEETDALIETHYDERIEFFQTFLDRDYLAYSMAWWGETADEAEAADITLEAAQKAKFDLICERAEIRGDERILNIGCGFGSFEKYLLARHPDVSVTAITPSRVQAAHLRTALDDPGSPLTPDNFRLLQTDFTALSAEDVTPGSFDLVISIGVVEHLKNMSAFNEKIAWLLKPGGRSFHHFIVSKMVIPQFLDARKSLIGAYFPGGRIWPFDEFPRHDRDLHFETGWFLNGMNYWRTLDEWHRRFWAGRAALEQRMTPQRLRHWNDYFILCKACFLPGRGSWFGNGHYRFRKPC